MGERKVKKRLFYEKHPYCCYCGGSRLAETEDHQPARVFFRDRQWPEGFVFPACNACNNVSRESERLVALLAHGSGGGHERTIYQRHLESIRRDYPHLVASMLPKGANEVRSMLRNKGLTRPPGVELSQIPVIKLEVDFWQPHFDIVARKIFLSLHYQCFGQILPHDGAMWLWTLTNADVPKADFLNEILNVADQVAIPIRNSRKLGEQFSVRYQVVDGKNAAIFLVHLHSALIFTGVTSDDKYIISSVDHKRRFSPFTM